ncbi:P-loop containing nucleoside triphosphate hydrolase protein [Halteromyces radiatus]|uniref:P-loop containing nucleoside triphosphate hydrolase protein n=1 Tax=Halteromyces radiatus TaxID=101107 RepID=UPI00221E530A|nr:P-loop containing nucleoside triphosphate hydrolase protein [Halteromyces radiatus]KAI8089933.1 P-loop containing nucleoside triphosphate hydrolase protein [Halteromyces radiatus]
MSAVPNHAGSWSTLPTPLSDETLEQLSLMGFDTMTPVQAGAIPLFLKNKDVVVEAVTGSGKTLAFVIPIIEKLLGREDPLKNHEIGAMIITPTRELAQQIYTVFDSFIQNHSRSEQLKLGLYIGGTTTLQQDMVQFNKTKPRILIGTPGRLEEMLMKSNKLINTKELEVLVMDEADRLLDMGFSQQLNHIIAQLPKQRRTGLFSATMTDAISNLVKAGLRNPVRVVVKVEDLENKGNTQRTPASLEIDYIVCDPEQKWTQVIRLLEHELQQLEGARKFIVYVATCACVDYFFKLLKKQASLSGYDIHSLHGQMETKRRSATYTSFTQLPPAVPAILLCTDVASRGLDIPDVDYVIQVDPPQDPKAFAHRCGRAARAGRKGKATVLLVRGREEAYVEFLKLRKIPISRANYLLPNGVTKDNSFIPDNDDETEKDVTSLQVVDPSVDQLIHDFRQVVKTDRDMYDRGIKAFVSWARAYSKHEASYIFRIKDLDLGRVATGYGLLKLPKMPELKNAKQVTFEEVDMDWNAYSYTDKNKELKRKRELEEAALKPKKPTPDTRRPKKTTAWSNKIEAKDRKADRRLKKDRKKDYLKRKQDSQQDTMDDNDDDLDDNDWDDLAKEERLAKKVRKGKISRQDFDAMMNDDDLDL